MKKRIIISIILVVILILGLLLPGFINNDKKIVDALTSFDFTPLDDEKFYIKQVSKAFYDDYVKNGDAYELLSFNFGTYVLSRTYMEKRDNIDFTYNGNYISDQSAFVEYNASYVYDDANIILVGKYDVEKDDFICNAEEPNELGDQKETLCSELNKYNKDFVETVNNIFNKNELNYLKQKTKD